MEMNMDIPLTTELEDEDFRNLFAKVLENQETRKRIPPEIRRQRYPFDKLAERRCIVMSEDESVGLDISIIKNLT